MKRNHALFLIALVALSIVALAACAPAATPTAAPATSAPQATAAPSGGSTGALKCDDKIGCVTIGPNDPIHFSWMFVVSGSDASLGVDSRRGVEIAVDDKGGKLLGHNIKLDGQDSLCSAEGGQAAAAKLAADNTILAVVGSSCSSEMRAGGPALSKAGFTIMSPSNTAPDLTDPNKRFAGYFRTAHNDKVQGLVAATFVLTQLKLTTAATIHDGSPYAEGLANAFAENFKKGGGTITTQEAVSPDDKDFKPVLTKIAATKPQIIFYPIFVAAGSLITQQVKSISGLESAKLMGADGILASDFIKAASKAALGMYFSSPDLSKMDPGKYPAFLDKYQKKYNTKPEAVFHAHSYDAANIIMGAIEKVAQKGADGSLMVGRQALRDAVAATKGYAGLTGNLTCDANGDCADPKIAVYQLNDTDISTNTVPSKPIWAPQ